MNKLLSILIIVLAFQLPATGQVTDEKKLLIGQWKFEKFIGTGQGSRQEMDSLSRYNKLNAGLIFTFRQDGKASTFLPGIPASENFKGVYRYYPKTKLLVMDRGNNESTSFRILQISSTRLLLGIKESIWQMSLSRIH